MSAVNQIVEYGVTEAALAELQERFNSMPDVSTKDGYEVAKAALKELTTLRTTVEAKRKEKSADAVAWKKRVDSEAKRITGKILEIETPIRAAKESYDAEIKAEKERKANEIKHKIDAIKNIPLSMLGASSGEIKSCISDVESDPMEGFGKQKKEALKARNDAVAHLRGILVMKESQELAAAQPVPESEPRTEEPQGVPQFADDDFAPFVEDDEPAPFGDGILDHALAIEDDEPLFFFDEPQQQADRREAVTALMELHGLDEPAAVAIIQSIESGSIPGVYVVFSHSNS